MTRSQLHDLRIGDLAVITGQAGSAAAVHIRPADSAAITLPATTDMDVCTVCIWLAWHRTLALAQDSYPGMRALRKAFTRTAAPTPDTPHYRHQQPEPIDGPVFVAADQYGYLDPRTPLSSRSLSHQLTACTSASPPTYRIVTPPETRGEDQGQRADVENIAADAAPAHDDLQTAHAAALGSARRDRTKLSDLDELFDELEDRIAQWNTTADALTTRAQT